MFCNKMVFDAFFVDLFPESCRSTLAGSEKTIYAY